MKPVKTPQRKEQHQQKPPNGNYWETLKLLNVTPNCEKDYSQELILEAHMLHVRRDLACDRHPNVFLIFLKKALKDC